MPKIEIKTKFDNYNRKKNNEGTTAVLLNGEIESNQNKKKQKLILTLVFISSPLSKATKRYVSLSDVNSQNTYLFLKQRE